MSDGNAASLSRILRVRSDPPLAAVNLQALENFSEDLQVDYKPKFNRTQISVHDYASCHYLVGVSGRTSPSTLLKYGAARNLWSEIGYFFKFMIRKM
jgi:hypothetical protein